MNPGAVIIQVVIGGAIWFFILGYFLRDQHIEFFKVVLWYGGAWAIGVGFLLLDDLGVLDLPYGLMLILSVLLKSAVIALFLRIEYSAWPFKRLVPAILAYLVINAVEAAWTLIRGA